MTLDKALAENPTLKNLERDNEQVRELIEVARRLEGVTRHASVHAAGVVIAPDAITEFRPALQELEGRDHDAQWAMKEVERVGLLKMDFLGLSTLTLLQDAVEHVERTLGKTIRLEALPLDDEPTYRLFSEGQTLGIFQFESSGMRETLRKARPRRFDDLIALNALYRPGPLRAGVIDDFIKRKDGKVEIEYLAPALEPILRETYGVIAYQEQVMRIASDLAGFTMGEADVLRKAMGKKNAAAMQAQRAKFVSGATARDLPEATATRIFDLMEYFAGYGFNKSHSTAYALLAYHTAYLKANYPAHFMAALLTIERQNTDKLALYLGECRDLGVTILPPDVNESELAFTVTPRGVRFGLGAVKNVGDGAVEAILAARRAAGGLASLERLCEEVDPRTLNRRALESLIKAGACDSLLAAPAGAEDDGAAARLRSAQLLAMLDAAMEQGGRRQRDREQGQHQLFGDAYEAAAGGESVRRPAVPPWTEGEKLAFEKEALGLYLSGHPIDRFQRDLQRAGVRRIEALDGPAPAVRVGGVVSQCRRLRTRKGDPMAVATLEDRGGRLEAVVFPEPFRRCGALLDVDRLVVVSGKLEMDDDVPRLLAEEVQALENVLGDVGRPLAIRLAAPPADRATIEALAEVLGRHDGNGRVALEIELRNQAPPVRVRARLNRARVRPSDTLVAELEGVCGKGAVSW